MKKLKLKTIRVRQAQCCKCGWRWLPKKEQPQQCPKCHDRLWWQGHAYKTYKGTVHEVTAVRRTPRKRVKPVAQPEPTPEQLAAWADGQMEKAKGWYAKPKKEGAA